MDWNNIGELFNQNKMLKSGDALIGSACFLLPILRRSDLYKLGDINLVAIDYSGDSTWFPVSFTDSADQKFQPRVYFRDSVDRWNQKARGYDPPYKDEFIKNRKKFPI
jgi:hypothetical protein